MNLGKQLAAEGRLGAQARLDAYSQNDKNRQNRPRYFFVFNRINPAAMRTGLCIYGDSLFAKFAVESPL